MNQTSIAKSEVFWGIVILFLTSSAILTWEYRAVLQNFDKQLLGYVESQLELRRSHLESYVGFQQARAQQISSRTNLRRLLDLASISPEVNQQISKILEDAMLATNTSVSAGSLKYLTVTRTDGHVIATSQVEGFQNGSIVNPEIERYSGQFMVGFPYKKHSGLHLNFLAPITTPNGNSFILYGVVDANQIKRSLGYRGNSLENAEVHLYELGGSQKNFLKSTNTSLEFAPLSTSGTTSVQINPGNISRNISTSLDEDEIFVRSVGLLPGTGWSMAICVNRSMAVKYPRLIQKGLLIVGFLLLMISAIVIRREASWRTSSKAKLNLANIQLEQALQAGKAGVFDWDIATGLAECSKSYFALYGIPESNPVSYDDWVGRLDPAERQKTISHIDAIIANPEKDEYEFEQKALLPGGSSRWLSTHGILLRDDAGKATRLIGVQIDVTSLKESSQSLERYSEELLKDKLLAEAAVEAREEFIANVSHDLRTPLTAIDGFAELLSTTVKDEKGKRYLQRIRANSALLVKLVNDLLDAAYIRSGKIKLQLAVTDVHQLVVEIEESVSLSAERKGLRLSMTWDPSVPRFVKTDRLRLYQIIENLVGNAVKYTDQGHIEVEFTARKIAASNNPDMASGSYWLKVKVTDTGCGIPEKSHLQLFTPFETFSGSYTKPRRGTGLGLYLCRKLATSLGGEVSLESSVPKKGSVFIAEILVDQVGSISTSEQMLEISEKGPLKGLSVLLVEDSEDVSLLVKTLLKQEGARVDTAKDGIEGKERALGGGYDIILMDLQMPRLDGYETISCLRKEGYNRPVIALTAHANESTVLKCKQAGFADHLAKPIDLPRMVTCILEYCPRA